jgi:hypothetical protein
MVTSRTCGTMTISLPVAMLAKIERARALEDRTRSEFVRQAIRVYLAQGDGERRAMPVDADPQRQEVRAEPPPDRPNGGRGGEQAREPTRNRA